MTNYLEVTNLSKSFDSFQLHNISFTLPKGYIMGLIGPNGSGKTTTIKLILNMLKRTGGTVKVMGLDNITEEQKVKSELGVVFDTNYFSDDWKVSQVEKSISVFYQNWNSQKFADMLRKFHIAPTKKVKELSKWFDMWLNQQDMGIDDIFTEDVIYTESWSPQYNNRKTVKHWFQEWNTRGKVVIWEIKQFFHKGDQTVVEWYFKNKMNNGSIEEFDGISLVEWTEDNRIKALKEFGCNRNTYNPYQEGDTPQFRVEKANWF